MHSIIVPTNKSLFLLNKSYEDVETKEIDINRLENRERFLILDPFYHQNYREIIQLNTDNVLMQNLYDQNFERSLKARGISKVFACSEIQGDIGERIDLISKTNENKSYRENYQYSHEDEIRYIVRIKNYKRIMNDINFIKSFDKVRYNIKVTPFFVWEEDDINFVKRLTPGEKKLLKITLKTVMETQDILQAMEPIIDDLKEISYEDNIIANNFLNKETLKSILSLL